MSMIVKTKLQVTDWLRLGAACMRRFSRFTSVTVESDKIRCSIPCGSGRYPATILLNDFTLICDSDVRKQLADEISKAYAAEVVIDELTKSGLAYTETTADNGDIEFELEVA